MASVPKEDSDREDGEIVEDEFEDISDNSIILTTTGKCFSPKEHLPEISLSSVSEAEDIKKFKQQRYRIQKSRRTHRKRKYSHRKTICLNSDSDEYEILDRNLFRAAIHIDNPDCLRNSLHTRLKAMTQIGDDSNKTNDNDNQPPEIQSQNISSDDGDDELIQLRLEALRTAVLNKFKHRKKIKCKEILESDDDIFTDHSEKTDDKENSNRFNNENAIHQTEANTQEISSKSQSSVETIAQNNPQEEDEDVLRALLLASLSKNISKENNIKNNKVQPPNEGDIYSFNKTVPKNDKNFVVTNPYKKTSLIKKNLPLQHSKVQPIIININCDSDSDEECHNNVSRVPQKLPNPTIETSVEKFLKEERAKVEAGNTKSEGVKSDFFNKSALKLLPKIKQIEYHNLLKKLHDKQLKQREKKKVETKLTSNSVSIKHTDTHKKQFVNQKKFIRNKIPQRNHLEQIPDLRNEVRLLHKVLKEIQTNKCERLQMQTKYTSLTPLVRKINEASIERKKYDKEIGRLLEELAEAKKKLRETHLSISSYVKELIVKKEEIDKQSIDIPDMTTAVPYSSTPIKDNDCKTIPPDKNVVVTNDNKSDSFSETKTHDCKTDECETEIKTNGIVNNKEHKYSQTSATVPKYISPLDNMERMDTDDPFLIMCPYDIDGNCRDPECAYKHYQN